MEFVQKPGEHTERALWTVKSERAHIWVSCVRVLGAHLNQGHVGAEGEQDLLGFGGIRVIPVFIQPLFERPGHVLKSLPLVPHLPSAHHRQRRRKRQREILVSTSYVFPSRVKKLRLL